MRTRHWATIWCVAAPSYQHVVPCNDTEHHEPTVHCFCSPRKVLIEDGPHIIAVQFQHNAFDGRLA